MTGSSFHMCLISSQANITLKYLKGEKNNEYETFSAFIHFKY